MRIPVKSAADSETKPATYSHRTGCRHYRSDPAICRNAAATRTVTRHVRADERERTDANRLTSWGKTIYKRRKETVERSFADAKQLYDHRYGPDQGPKPKARRRDTHTSRRNPLDSANPKTKNPPKLSTGLPAVWARR
ncbi:hypothetical protein LPJGGPFB_05265 [Ensifer adhaerens]|uniref:Uncharacterized protein n=1 Tax=Ensifer adhaerens TaxID=106592 RepID=A0ACC5T5F8_ENSAD|nr:hypothetical protein [Ensifer adhaerens]NRP22006.1 hypothetical protein [Ensifer adhaerens]